jgi:hypothetical protein
MDLLKLFNALAEQQQAFKQETTTLSSVADAISAELNASRQTGDRAGQVAAAREKRAPVLDVCSAQLA